MNSRTNQSATPSEARSRRCLLLMPPHTPEPQGLLDALDQRNIAVDMVDNAPQVMVRLAEQEYAILIVAHPHTLPDAASLYRALKSYHDYLKCWQYQQDARRDRPELSQWHPTPPEAPEHPTPPEHPAAQTGPEASTPRQDAKPSEDHQSKSTTTQHPTQQPTQHPTQAGHTAASHDPIEWDQLIARASRDEHANAGDRGSQVHHEAVGQWQNPMMDEPVDLPQITEQELMMLLGQDDAGET